MTEWSRLDEDICRGQECRESFAVDRRAEIENEAPLVRIRINEGEAALRMLDISGKRRQQPVRVAARRLDLDHVGAQVGELPRRIGGGDVTEFDDAEMAESCWFVQLHGARYRVRVTSKRPSQVSCPCSCFPARARATITSHDHEHGVRLKTHD